MLDDLIDSFNELIASSKTYKVAFIRITMIVSLTFCMTGVTLVFNNFPSILRLLNNIVVRTSSVKKGLSISSILKIEKTLSAIKLPAGYTIGIENIKAVGAREILWVSSEKNFSELNKEDLSLLNRNPKRLQYAKGYSYLVGACNLAPIVRKHYNYNYYVCPIRSNMEVIGIVWVLYDVELENSEQGLDLQSELIPILLEIRDLLETHGLK